MRIAIVLIAATALAGASFKTGSYVGQTAQGLPVSFTAGKHSVHAFTFQEKGACSDGRTSSGTQGPFAMHVNKKGKFSESGTSPSGAAKSHVSGKLKKGHASGTLRIDSSFDAAGNPDANGSVKCTTGDVHWSASHHR